MATQDGFHNSFRAPSLLRPWDLCPYSIKWTNLEHLRVSWFLDPTQRLSGACQWPGACSIYIKKLSKMQSSRYCFATDPSFHTGHCGPAGSLVQNWVFEQWSRVMVKYAWSRTFFLSSRLNREELIMKHENSFLELKSPSWTRPWLFCLYPTQVTFFFSLHWLPFLLKHHKPFIPWFRFILLVFLPVLHLDDSYSLNLNSSMKPSLIIFSKMEPLEWQRVAWLPASFK